MRLLLVGLTASVLAVASCSDGTAPQGDALNAARRRWANSGLNPYSFVLARGCECTQLMAGPVAISVRDGVVQSRLYRSDGTPVPATLVSLFPSVEGLFDFIAAALQQEAYRVEVTYDADTGFPAHISVDYDRLTVDDEITYTATDLRSIVDN